MIKVSKIDKNPTATGGNLTDEDVLQYCQLEKNQVLNIVPEKQFIDYLSVKRGQYYYITCTYRNQSLYKYRLDPKKGTDSIEQWIPAIYKYLCKIICNNYGSITNNEIQFLLQILHTPSLRMATCKQIIISYVDYLPESIQQYCFYKCGRR